MLTKFGNSKFFIPMGMAELRKKTSWSLSCTFSPVSKAWENQR